MPMLELDIWSFEGWRAYPARSPDAFVYSLTADDGVNSFSTRLLSSCTDECAHTYDIVIAQ